LLSDNQLPFYYLKDKQLSDYHADTLIFKDDNLQRAVFEELKLNKKNIVSGVGYPDLLMEKNGKS